MQTIEQAVKEARKPLEELIVIETVNVIGVALPPDGIDLATVERIVSKDKRTLLFDSERSFLDSWPTSSVLVGYRLRCTPLSLFCGWGLTFEINHRFRVLDNATQQVPMKFEKPILLHSGDNVSLRVAGPKPIEWFQIRLEFYGFEVLLEEGLRNIYELEGARPS